MVDKSWIHATMERVTNKYRPAKAPTPLPIYKDSFLKGEFAFDGDLPSNSNPNIKYHVTVKFNGESTCTCKGFGYRHTCSHIDMIKEVLKGL